MTDHTVSQSDKMASQKCAAAWALECPMFPSAHEFLSRYSTVKEVTAREMAMCGTLTSKMYLSLECNADMTNRTRTSWLFWSVVFEL